MTPDIDLWHAAQKLKNLLCYLAKELRISIFKFDVVQQLFKPSLIHRWVAYQFIVLCFPPLQGSQSNLQKNYFSLKWRRVSWKEFYIDDAQI